MKINGPGQLWEKITPEPTGKTRTAATFSNDQMPLPEAKNALTMDDFFKLMAIQLQNQDMNSPMSNSEMMNQLVQMASIEAMASMTSQVANSYAAGLIGQQVDVVYIDGKVKVHDNGTITGINMSTYPPTVYLDDKKVGYPMSSIAFIGQNKLEEDEVPGDGEKPEDGAKPEDGVKPEGGEKPGDKRFHLRG